MSEKHFLYLCYYDPEGISTVPQIITHMRQGSSFKLSVINLFEHIKQGDNLALSPSVDLDSYDGIIIHNTVSYSVYNLRALDLRTKRKLKHYRGIKILMKQDENHMLRPLAQYIGETGFDVIFTCLGLSDIPKVYPPHIVGNPRFERMLTGYVTPGLREEKWDNHERPIDIGYRGSIQPLSFGRLAYEKRQIGNEVAKRLNGDGLNLDISSQWEDRICGQAWFDFMRQCKAVLGSESGASVFDLDGKLEKACRLAEKNLGKEREDAEYAEAYLSYFADLEGNVDYAQISPRHFEAAACGAAQLLHPGSYSGVLEAGKHYFPLARDFSNLQEAVAFLKDESKRYAMAEAAHREVIMNQDNWIETFIARFDQVVREAMEKKATIAENTTTCRKRKICIPHISLQMLMHCWVRLPYSWQQRLKPLAKRILNVYQRRASPSHTDISKDAENH